MILLMAHSKRSTPDWADVCKQLRLTLQDSLDELDSALYGQSDPAVSVDLVVSDLKPVLEELSAALGGA